MKKNTISLSKIINSKIKKDTLWFQPVFDLKIGRIIYTFWIPFEYKIVNKKTNVIFNTIPLRDYFNHFNSLNWENFSLNSWYNNILDISKNIWLSTKKALLNILNIKTVKENLIKSGYLIEKKTLKISDNNLDFSLDLDLEEKKSLSKEQLTSAREKIKITSFKDQTTKELKEISKKLWLKNISEDYKSYYMTILSKYALLEEKKGKVEQHEKDYICQEALEFIKLSWNRKIDFTK